MFRSIVSYISLVTFPALVILGVLGIIAPLKTVIEVLIVGVCAAWIITITFIFLAYVQFWWADRASDVKPLDSGEGQR